MSSQPTPDPATVSQVAQQEGGTTKGSTSAQMQSEMTKQANAEQVDAHVADKLAKGEPITKQEASLAESRESRAMGGQRPPPGSVAAQAQSAAAKDAAAPQKDANLAKTTSDVKAKLDSAPQTVTPDDANKARSAETKAKGVTEKGGVAAQAQSQAAANQGTKK
ncbi:MAG: hypothetical protein M1828_000913 [Chrysothrix sp. TS-e1954]|nr:MAG: hypothetical protein M1828_000913 [Chrysothrix sp. TS-e1954]